MRRESYSILRASERGSYSVTLFSQVIQFSHSPSRAHFFSLSPTPTMRTRQRVTAWESAETGCEKEEGGRGRGGLREGVGQREKE